jgi:GR25 family glycosyltransferase involved in LPS biosynthesis
MNFPENFATVILHLPHRVEREPLIDAAVETLGIEQYDIVEGFTPETNPFEIPYGQVRPIKWAIACSFRKALEKALESDKPYILFLEDDAVIHPDCQTILREVLDKVPEFDIIYGGWCIGRQKQDETDFDTYPQPVFVQGGVCVCNHCLLMPREMAELLVEQIGTVKYWAYEPMSNDFAMSSYINREGFRRYLVNPMLALQKNGIPSDNTDGGERGVTRTPQKFNEFKRRKGD